MIGPDIFFHVLSFLMCTLPDYLIFVKVVASVCCFFFFYFCLFAFFFCPAAIVCWFVGFPVDKNKAFRCQCCCLVAGQDKGGGWLISYGKKYNLDVSDGFQSNWHEKAMFSTHHSGWGSIMIFFLLWKSGASGCAGAANSNWLCGACLTDSGLVPVE